MTTDDGRSDDHLADEGDDEDDEPEERLPGSRAAYAVNWKTVLAVDAAMGVVVAVAGVVMIAVWNFYLGVAFTGLGLFYVAMVLRRGRTWARLRADAGL
jgi:hypothetical protein